MKRFLISVVFIVIGSFRLATAACNNPQCNRKQQASTFLTTPQAQSLWQILDLLNAKFPRKELAQSIKDAIVKVRAQKTLPLLEAVLVLEDVQMLLVRRPFQVQVVGLPQRILTLKTELLAVHQKKAMPKKAVQKPVAKKPAVAPKRGKQVAANIGSTALKTVKGSVRFSQAEGSKAILFVTPFQAPPVVVITIRFKDVTFATPVVSGVTTKGFTVKGLSLPPPETNYGFIDFIAIG